MTNPQRDLPGGPGLMPSGLSSERGPYVGSAPSRGGLRRMARDARLDRLLLGLHRGFGWQRWWPARRPFEVIVGDRGVARVYSGADLPSNTWVAWGAESW